MAKQRRPIIDLVRSSCAQLNKVTAASESQRKAFASFTERTNLLMLGTPRTGKTFVAMYLALSEVEAGRRDKVYVIRSAVPSRDIGFLPGDTVQKMAAYERAYSGIISELYSNPAALHNLRTNGSYEFMSTSFLRGTTLRDCVVIVDEVQNMSFSEINTIITRLGKNSRLIVAGDMLQCDFEQHKKSGFDRAVAALSKMPSFGRVDFGVDDIVGSPVIKEWLIASGQA